MGKRYIIHDDGAREEVSDDRVSSTAVAIVDRGRPDGRNTVVKTKHGRSVEFRHEGGQTVYAVKGVDGLPVEIVYPEHHAVADIRDDVALPSPSTSDGRATDGPFAGYRFDNGKLDELLGGAWNGSSIQRTQPEPAYDDGLSAPVPGNHHRDPLEQLADTLDRHGIRNNARRMSGTARYGLAEAQRQAEIAAMEPPAPPKQPWLVRAAINVAGFIAGYQLMKAAHEWRRR